MARLKQGTPQTYRHHKPSGQAVVTIDGRDIYLGVYGQAKSKAEYAWINAEYAVTGAVARETAEADGRSARC